MHVADVVHPLHAVLIGLKVVRDLFRPVFPERERDLCHANPFLHLQERYRAYAPYVMASTLVDATKLGRGNLCAILDPLRGDIGADPYLRVRGEVDHARLAS